MQQWRRKPTTPSPSRILKCTLKFVLNNCQNEEHLWCSVLFNYLNFLHFVMLCCMLHGLSLDRCSSVLIQRLKIAKNFKLAVTLNWKLTVVSVGLPTGTELKIARWKLNWK